jgi:hypothetical protein
MVKSNMLNQKAWREREESLERENKELRLIILTMC